MSADCWIIGIRHTGGYRTAKVAGRNVYMHRFMYEKLVGPIPGGYDIDHLCRNRACCNPDHLEAVTRQENLRRGRAVIPNALGRTHCPRGHVYDDENLYVWKGKRYCRACRRESRRAVHA